MGCKRMKFRPFTTAVTLLKCVDQNQQTFWIRALEDSGTSPAGCDTQEESRG